MTQVLYEVSKHYFIFWPELPGQLTQFFILFSVLTVIRQ